MPAGIEHPVLGYAVFVGVKVAGYALAAQWISRSYGRTDRNPWIVGAVRTLIGMAAGALYAGLIALVAHAATRAGTPLFLLGLLPLRIAEWWLLVWWFYDRPLERKKLGWKTVGWATLWSFVVDVPAIAGLFLTGGMWIC